MSSLAYLPVLVLALFPVLSAATQPYGPQCPADNDERWSYRGSQNGLTKWKDLFPRDCSGKSQSPIDINRPMAKHDENLEPLYLNNYNFPITDAIMVNNGHTVQIIPKDGVRRTIIVDGKEQVLEQFHFHWGRSANEGSEHTIDKMAYAMEVHFVHRSDDGRYAVVGVFFKEHDENKFLQPIVNSLSDIPFRNDRTSLKSSLVLNDLLPKNPATFYRYYGSLTTPDCTEGVIWSVIPEPISVGILQMKKFRLLFSVTRAEASEGENQNCQVAPNYRPPQDLNGRSVYYSS